MSDERVTKLQELVYELRVGEIMHEDVISVSPETPMSELREILRINRISGTPVMRDGSLVGMISIEDFIRWLVKSDGDCRVEAKMTRDVRTVFADEPLIQAVNKLERFGFGRLPVLDRKSGKLAGVLTKGDIIEGLLKKLEIDYHEAEMMGARSSHVFEDIIADSSALLFEYQVPGKDFTRAGACASGLKTTLRRLGIHPQTARRAAIACYEAEMNLIVHTDGGRIEARVDGRAIRIQALDEGPGIEDVARAMQPGYSTAPDWVRELGFGAGMGLVNIDKCADRMEIDSTTGKGTRIEVEILLETEP
ncbi:MAG: CBS domain-containing protein [Deltaproteobacteria bacterium]|nr:CBS domain-containing protein [Deltaproteobacteria bacterium]